MKLYNQDIECSATKHLITVKTEKQKPSHTDTHRVQQKLEKGIGLPSTKQLLIFNPIFRKHSLSSSVIISKSASCSAGTHLAFNFDNSLVDLSIFFSSCRIHIINLREYQDITKCKRKRKIQ